MRTAHPVEQEPRYGWVVVWASFTALAVIFGVAYSFAAFFASFSTAFAASRAEVSLVFGVSGLLCFVLGAFGGMWALVAGVLLLGLGAALLLRRAPAAARRADGTVPGMSLGEAVRSRSFRWLYLMCVCAAPAMFIPFAHLSAAARDIGVPDAQAIGLVGLIGIGSLSGRFAIGAVADHAGRPLTMLLMQASLGASMLLWWGAAGYPALVVFALWMGVSYGGIVSLMPAMCMDLYGARAVSSTIGVLYTGAALGNVAGPWLAGRMFDAQGSYAAVILGCTALSLVATCASWRAVRRI